MYPNPKKPAVARRATEFLDSEQGGVTALTMVAFISLCLLGGLAMDITNLHRQKEHLTLAADAGAQAGIVALSQSKTEAEIKAAMRAAVEDNAPLDVVGKTNNGTTDLQLVRFDQKTRTLVPGTPNAVRVILHRDGTVENPVQTGFLRLAGIDEFEVTVESVAFYGEPSDCTSSDMIYGKGQVTLTSGIFVGKNYCVHSQESVWMPQQNMFQTGAGVSMPNVEDCKSKCVDSANPGVEDAFFTMNLVLPPVSDHIAKVQTAMLAASSDIKTTFFTGKSLAVSMKPLSDAKIMTVGQANKLVKGSVVSLTAAKFNDLMIATAGNLPTGLVYNVDCKNNGNSPATSIAIGSGKDRKNATLTSTTLETVRQVVIIADCSLDIGPNARIDAAVVVSTRNTNASAIDASESAVLGDPLKNCDISRKVYIMTMGGVSVPANFTASNVSIMSNGDINLAANSSSTETIHVGSSLHAEGRVHVAANNTFATCAEDKSPLLPSAKTFKFVMPAS